MGPPEERIRDLARSLAGLTWRAVAEYTPVVDSLVRGRSGDVLKIERTLDGLLDFCFDPDALGLYKRLCRHYPHIDPAATAAYVAAYQQLWARDWEQPP